MITKKGQGDVTLMALKIENGNQEPRNVDSLWKMENARNGFSSVASKKEHSPAITVIFSSMAPVLVF